MSSVTIITRQEKSVLAGLEQIYFVACFEKLIIFSAFRRGRYSFERKVILGRELLKHSETSKSNKQHNEKEDDKNMVDDLSNVNTIPPETTGRTNDSCDQVRGL